MPYNETTGERTVYPGGKKKTSSARSGRSRKKAPRRASAGRSKRTRAKPSCKYGPRDAEGYCPKKPRAPRREPEFFEDDSPPPRRAPARRRRSPGIPARLERKVEAAAARAVEAAAPKAVAVAARAKAFLGTPLGKIGTVGAAGFAGALSAAALAGIASFAITTKILNVRKRRKMDRAELLAAQADAYRLSRLQAEEEQGFPLSVTQHKTLAGIFKAQLVKAGLSSTNLKGL